MRNTQILSTLKEIADPGHSALIIIDAQHDFCSEKGAMAQRFGFDMKEIREAVPRLNEFIKACRETGVFVVWVREIFSDKRMHNNQKSLWGAGDDIWLIPEGGKGIEWYEGMIPPLESEPVVTKWQYDAFQGTDLERLLQAHGIKTLLMTGFTTNVCVESTARHGYEKGYYIVLASDCSGTPTPAEHEAAVFNIKTYYGQAVPSGGIVQLWQDRQAKAA